MVQPLLHRRRAEGGEDKILKSKPGKAYVFFNNDTNMLKDSRRLLNLLKGS